jgi:hypothetical protein
LSVAAPVEVVSQEDKAVLFLRGSVGVADAYAVHDAALQLAAAAEGVFRGVSGGSDVHLNIGSNRGPSFEVNMSEVEAMDVAVLQILAALEAEFTRQGATFEIRVSSAIERHWHAAGWRDSRSEHARKPPPGPGAW